MLKCLAAIVLVFALMVVGVWFSREQIMLKIGHFVAPKIEAAARASARVGERVFVRNLHDREEIAAFDRGAAAMRVAPIGVAIDAPGVRVRIEDRCAMALTVECKRSAAVT